LFAHSAIEILIEKQTKVSIVYQNFFKKQRKSERVKTTSEFFLSDNLLSHFSVFFIDDDDDELLFRVLRHRQQVSSEWATISVPIC
jgi:hypothetical protein